MVTEITDGRDKRWQIWRSRAIARSKSSTSSAAILSSSSARAFLSAHHHPSRFTMGPVRTEKSNSRSNYSSNPIAGPSKRKSRRPYNNPEPSVSTGVQKIKAAIRQTKRLLAKVIILVSTLSCFTSEHDHRKNLRQMSVSRPSES